MISKKSIFVIFLYFFSFILIYNPSIFFNFNLAYILTIISFVVILITKNSIKYFLYNKRFLAFTFFNIFYLMYAFAIDASEKPTRWFTFFVTYLGVVNAYAFVLIFIKVYGFDFDRLLDFLIKLGLIQVVFVILSILIPEFRDWVLSSVRSNSDIDFMSISNDYGGIRSFGLSSNFTSGFPMFMGILSLFSLYFLINKKQIKYKLYYGFSFLLFLFTVVLNARIGLAPLIFFLLLYPLIIFNNLRNMATFFVITCTGLIFSLSLWNYLSSNKYFERLKMGYEEIEFLFKGDKTGNLEVLSNMFFIPTNFHSFLFGSGVDVFGGYKLSSDIGFVRDLFMLGFLYCLLFVVVVYYLMKPFLFYAKNKFGFIFVVIVICSLFVFYWKGMIYSSTEIYSLIFILSVFSCLKYSFKIN